ASDAVERHPGSCRAPDPIAAPGPDFMIGAQPVPDAMINRRRGRSAGLGSGQRKGLARGSIRSYGLAAAGSGPAADPRAQHPSSEESIVSAPRTRPAVADPVVVPAGTTCADAVAAAGLPTTGPKAVVVVRDPEGNLRDLSWAPATEVRVEPVTIDSPDGLNVLRHSTAHVLAQAVQDLFPEAKLGIGPPIDHGFYYDFDVARPFQPEDLDKLTA